MILNTTLQFLQQKELLRHLEDYQIYWGISFCGLEPPFHQMSARKSFCFNKVTNLQSATRPCYNRSTCPLHWNLMWANLYRVENPNTQLMMFLTVWAVKSPLQISPQQQAFRQVTISSWPHTSHQGLYWDDLSYLMALFFNIAEVCLFKTQ